MRALGFEPKKEEIRKMISDIDKDGSGMHVCRVVFNVRGILDIHNVNVSLSNVC